jgi:two-component sensor histidine kinase
MLAKQIGGMLHLASEGGTIARIAFPVRPHEKDPA